MDLKSWRLRVTGRNPSWLDQCLRMALRLGCPVYFMAVVLRNWMFDKGVLPSFRASRPVISIGNLSVGGTGKTPAVAWFANWLKRQGWKVVLLSRGYGKLQDGRNDEALELEIRLPGIPHLQHPDRVASAKRACEEFDANVLLLDDGFQHRRLGRDMDIVLIDCTDTPAAEWLLPAGLRREPFYSVRRAEAVILTRADQVSSVECQEIADRVRKYNPSALCLRAVHRPQSLLQFPAHVLSLDRLSERPVLAFCGIGNPEAYFEMLGQLGAELLDQHAWPDHHNYSQEDLNWIEGWAERYPEAPLVCTVKDWVKLQQPTIGRHQLWAVSIELEFFDDTVELESRLRSVLGPSEIKPG